MEHLVRFVQRAEQVGVEVARVDSPAAAAEHVAGWCRARGAASAAVWSVPAGPVWAPALAAVAGRLAAAGLEVIGPEASPARVAGADIGVTGAAWGIAETGTLVLEAGPGQPRLTSLLPPAHVALLAASRVVADLEAVFAAVGAVPSALTLVTGPSRSADIGLVPVLGAHGPTTVHVVVIESA